MLRRIELEERALTATNANAAESPEPIVPSVAESDFDQARLPPDHPSWVRDAVALSNRARDLLAKVKPVVVAVLSVWDHHFRSIVVAGRCLRVDPSGSYRTDP